MNNTKLLIVFVIVFLFAGAVTYAITPISPKRSVAYTKPTVNGVIDDSDEPKTEECPLNGAMKSKSARALWEKRRPLGIMIENSVDARPQSGLSAADVVFEAVAEGGITRFLAVFYCTDVATVGPVRSARVYFMDFLGGFGNYPLYAHVGGANTPGPADALGQLEKMGWTNYNDLNQFSVGFPVFWRDYERLPGVATEHTMYTSTVKLWDIAKTRELTEVDEDGERWDKDFSYKEFKNDPSQGSRPNSLSVSYAFWDSQPKFNTTWTYQRASNSFVRSTAGQKHVDKNTGNQLAAKNVVILFMDESVADDGYDQGQHLLYGTKGSGKAMILQDGKAVDGTWEKDNRFSPLTVMNKKGEEITYTRGPTWFIVIPTGNTVTVD